MRNTRVAIIGAGLGGLAAAVRLAHAGADVTVFERHATPGGKMRTVKTPAGPVDAGPTVLTMRPVFEDLFRSVGETLTDHVTLLPQDLLARHVWSDGSQLDLFADHGANIDAIRAFSGAASAREFEAFSDRTRTLFDAFDQPMMKAARPSLAHLGAAVLSRPSLAAAMQPTRTLAASLRKTFSDPRLAQLFGRYATYVGGSPTEAPAILSLIWQAEAAGVWQVKGGMHGLAVALERLARSFGATFRYQADVRDITVVNGRATGLRLSDGGEELADRVIFNGDPNALFSGCLGPDATRAVGAKSVNPRSHSAHVWSFAAVPQGVDLALHTIFFGQDPAREFDDLAAGRLPRDPTLYIYAQDRGGSAPPERLERFEIIMNAPPITGDHTEERPWKTRTFATLARMGLRFTPEPEATTRTLATPRTFDTLFPASRGSLYGRSPHGMMAPFQRPTAQSRIPGLLLAGGGCHPGAGIPMATLSGWHAAEAILQDPTLRSKSARTATRGGMSTGSPTTANAQYRSSAS